jgi:hypothetical protein
MQSLGEAFTRLGLVCPNPIADENLHRCGTLKKPRGKKNGWYIIFDGGRAAVFGNWELGDGYEYWREEGVTDTDWRRIKAKIDAARQAQETTYEEAAQEASALFDAASPEGYSDYLKGKRCYPHGARFDGTTVIIPVQDAAGKIWSIQRIYNDGSRYFLTGGKVRGCYYPIFPARNVSKSERVIVCEGFATGASIHQASGLPVIVAFSAGNLKPVADNLPFRNIVIAADHDASGTGERAAKESGYPHVMPEVEGWDFSDAYLDGKDVAKYFRKTATDRATVPELPSHGLVAEIADWITATAIRPQPMLSLAAALTFIAALKGHRIAGGTDLRTNLLILSLAPTASGKEHPQNCIKRLMTACGLTKHLLGEPVSGGGFLTGLLKADRRGLLVMDEMGRYISNLSSKQAGTHQREIIDYIIKSFSCAGGILQGRQYVDEKKNPCIAIEQPHFCCLGSTVAERFQAACSSREVIDGFLNRWLVFSVNKRARRVDKPTGGANDIPAHILNTVAAYAAKPISQTPYGNPNPMTVKFTPEAWDIFVNYRDGMDNLVDTASYPMDQLYSRSSEHMEKIALTLCDDEFIGIADVQAAIAIVNQSNIAIMEFAGLIADNVSEQDFLRVKEIIKKAGSIARDHLARKCQFVSGGRKRLDEILDVLINANVICATKTGKKTIYKFIAE